MTHATMKGIAKCYMELLDRENYLNYNLSTLYKTSYLSAYKVMNFIEIHLFVLQFVYIRVQ